MIIEQFQKILASGKGKTIPEIVERIPELCGREEAGEMVHLLLRLDHRFSREGEYWFSKKIIQNDPEVEILNAIKAYFSNTKRKGELLIHLIQAVGESTKKTESQIKQVIVRHYQIVQGGKMVLNRTKEKKHG